MDQDHHEGLSSNARAVPRPLADVLDAGGLSPSTTTSPVTDLARNLGGLLSSGRNGTPRRRISWSSNEDTPKELCNLRKSRLFLGGNMADSPQMSYQQDSPMFQDRLLRDVSVADNCFNTTGSRLIRRVRTLPHTSRPPLHETCGKENIPRGQLEQEEDSGLPSSLHMPKSLYSSHLPTSSPTSCTSSTVICPQKKGRVPFSPICDLDAQNGDCAFLQEQFTSENSFMAPSHPPPRRNVSPLKSISNHQSIIRLNSAGSSFGCSSSERSSVSASGAESDDIDDGFLDIFDMDALDSDPSSSANDFHLPQDFHRLLRDPLSSESSENQNCIRYRQHSDSDHIGAVSHPTFYCAESPRKLPIRRCLSMIEESPVARPFLSPRQKLLDCVDRNNNCGINFRRPEDTRKRLLQDEEDRTFKKPCEPPLCMSDYRAQENVNKHTQETKRRKGVSYLTKSPSDSLVLPSPRNIIQRSHSETDAISRALQISTHNPDLIGDCSGSYALPLVKSKHDDLKAITCTTLSNLMNGVYKDLVDEFQIVDCRYPYEFEGGHIKGACNLYTKESILENLINKQAQPSSCKKRKILVFHCEFSSERGPNLSRFLRNKDREANEDNYPNLFHPEIYLLEGGYRDFFKQRKELCVPQDYLPMLSKDHENDLRKFRSKSKSWSGDTKSRVVVRPGLKL